MERWGWVAALAEPSFLMALAVAAGIPWLLFPGTVGLLLSVVSAAGMLWLDHRLGESVRRLPVRVGPEAMLGQTAVVVEQLEPTGVVNCGGELWRAAEILGRRVGPGGTVKVVHVRGLMLEVEASSTLSVSPRCRGPRSSRL